MPAELTRARDETQRRRAIGGKLVLQEAVNGLLANHGGARRGAERKVDWLVDGRDARAGEGGDRLLQRAIQGVGLDRQNALHKKKTCKKESKQQQQQ